MDNGLHRVQSDMLQDDINKFLAAESQRWTRERYEIRSFTWHVISPIAVSLLEKGPNNYVKVSHLKMMAFCFSQIFMPLLFVKWWEGYFHSFYDTHLASDTFRHCWSDQLLRGSHRWRWTNKSFPSSAFARALESQAGCCYQRCGRETEGGRCSVV